MAKKDKIWLAVGIPAFIFMVLFMNRTFSYDKSIAGKTSFRAGKYEILLKGAHFRSFWRNFYRIRRDAGAKVISINVKADKDLLYEMVNFDIKGVNPKKTAVVGASTSEIDKYSDGIKFTIRVGSRKNILLRIYEK
ncbi:MAG: hypothetical protein J7L54_00290 [Elusimicrobia bacterium]|nr:hypothetical protein [Elusimicrobiota bacterium]